MLKWIEEWYNSNCNGNWEHEHVIKIESLDNPGWHVEIDFNETDIIINNSPWKVYESSDSDWIGFSVKDNIFCSSGDQSKLELILKLFKYLCENKITPDAIDLQSIFSL